MWLVNYALIGPYKVIIIHGGCHIGPGYMILSLDNKHR